MALFRAEIVGALCHRDLTRGELADAIRALAECRYRPPDRRACKRFGISTLERWYYAVVSRVIEADTRERDR